MGNANGKEECIENGGGGGDDEVAEVLNPAQAARVNSADFMVSSPSRDLQQSRPPHLFSQAPVIPSQKNDGTPFNPLRQNESPRAVGRPLEQGIPTIITWSLGGNNVEVEGSWDNWRTRKLLHRSGKDHSVLLVLPSGIFPYKFIVDGEARYSPDLPRGTDDMGNVCNLLDVHDYVPENLDSVAEFEAPSSPEASYSQVFPGDEDFVKDPLLVPPQLNSTVLGSEGHKDSISSKPQHVILNHLFMEKGQATQSVVALGLTHRFQSKYVTVILYKPLKR